MDQSAAYALILAAMAGSPGTRPGSPPGPGGEMYINRPIREYLSRDSKKSYGLEIINRISRSIPVDFDKVQAVLDINNLIMAPVCLPTASMDISGALGTVVPCTLCGPWSQANILKGTYLMVTRVVYDVTTANTQLVMGIDLTVANCAPLTLPGTSGFAEDVNFILPQGFYLGLTTTNNGGDNARDLTIYGYAIAENPNGFNYGGTWYGVDLDGLT